MPVLMWKERDLCWGYSFRGYFGFLKKEDDHWGNRVEGTIFVFVFALKVKMPKGRLVKVLR